MDKMDSSEKRHWSENCFIISICGFLIALAVYGFINVIDQYQLFQGILSLLMYVVAGYSIFIAIRSNRLIKSQIEASVRPKLFFRIRPANDFWKPPWGPVPPGWKPGVGIYIENMGNGHALNVKMAVVIEGERESHRERESHKYDIFFPRLKVGVPNTIPSTDYPIIKISKNHSKIIIKDLEYDDIYDNHIPEKEPIILELNKIYFEGLDLRIYLFDPRADKNNITGLRVVVHGKFAYHMGGWVDYLVQDERVKVERVILKPGETYNYWLKKEGYTEVPRRPNFMELGLF